MVGETGRAFTEDLAELLGVPPDAIDPDATLIEDLGLDSVALAEVIVILITDYGAEELAQRLEYERWENRTVREVVSLFCRPTSRVEARES
jgi:acyl carrier protein